MKRGKQTCRILKDARRQIARKAIILLGISAGLAAISPIVAGTNSVYIHNCTITDCAKGIDKDTIIGDTIIGDTIIVSEQLETPPLSANDTLTTAPVMPEFPGGIEAFLKFIDKSIKEPPSGRCCYIGFPARTIVQFVIDKDGNVVNPKVIRGLDPMLDKEALRVIKLSSKWKPGELEDGTKVAVYYTVPVLFRPR